MAVVYRFDSRIATGYNSPSQRTRVMSEAWTARHIFCAACGGALRRAANNARVLDFHCARCAEQYELKSKANKFSIKITDGAWESMRDRLHAGLGPNFFFLAYERLRLQVVQFFVVPGHFLQMKTIERRKPLKKGADRQGWVGCNILLDQIPEIGRIHYIRNGIAVPEKSVTAAWSKTAFLKQPTKPEIRGWTLDVIACIERIGREHFALADVYAFEGELSKRHPGNRHVRDKIRQQLQVLRDHGYLAFNGRGNYRLVR